MNSSSALTRGIQVDVRSHYLPDQSTPDEARVADRRWVFAYEIRICNLSDLQVQLISRWWEIANAHGRIEHVRGPGVVGQQPVLRPGECFQYVSGCPLDTPFGSMKGSYQMVDADGEPFDVEIAEFSLLDPASVN